MDTMLCVEGIWEVRSGREHFVYSKVLLWVALDRYSTLTLDNFKFT